MRTLIFASAKGGTGKTSTAVNLAAGFASAGRRVIVLDLDPYGGATLSLGLPLEAEALSGALSRGTPLPVRQTAVERLSVIPAGEGLADASRRLSASPKALRRALEGLTGADVLVIDTPPAVGPLSVAAMACGGELIVPVGASFLDFSTLPPFLLEAGAVTRSLAPDLRLRAIVPSRVTRTNVSRETLEALRSRYNETTRAEIRLAVAVIEASAAGLPVLEYAPTAPVAEDFRELTRELSREKR